LTSNILYPLFKTGGYFYNTVGWIPKFFSDKNMIIEENKNLLSEKENYRLIMVDYESIKYENQKLRDELEVKPAGNFITASVVARPPQMPLDSLLLDRGTEDGINNGDFVLVGERILIGRVAKATGNKAVVALSSFANVASYGCIARTNEPLEIKGMGGGNIEAKIPIDFDIVVGDKIMVNNSFNYLVAVVGSTEEDRSSGFKDILMSLPVNISKINIVFIAPFISE